MNKIESLFRAKWADVTKGLQSAPTLTSVKAAPGSGHDLDVVFSATITPEIETLLWLADCEIQTQFGASASLLVPESWTVAPTRSMFPADEKDHLCNALLDAGVTDWIAIRAIDDGANLQVEFIDHPNADQIAALKAAYDVVMFEETTYTFAKRTAALTVDPAKVEVKLRQCWAGAHAGKIAKVEHTGNPRQFVVTTVKPIPANARLGDHGLKQMELYAPNRALVELKSDLWDKLVSAAKPAPAAPPVIEPSDPPFVSPLPEPTPEPPAMDERDVELAALKAQVAELQGIIAALTPVTDEWITLRLPLNADGKLTQHPEIADKQALGYRVHHVQYSGVDTLLVFMERSALPTNAGKYRVASTDAMNGRLNTSALSKHVIIGDGSFADAMIRNMNAEIAPAAYALMSALGVAAHG